MSSEHLHPDERATCRRIFAHQRIEEKPYGRTPLAFLVMLARLR